MGIVILCISQLVKVLIFHAFDICILRDLSPFLCHCLVVDYNM